jgi:hypothetical protein
MSLIVNAARVYIFVPFRGKDQATYSHFEIANVEGFSRASEVDKGKCRFFYDHVALPPGPGRFDVQSWITDKLFDVFPELCANNDTRITFPAAILGRRYIDIWMGTVVAPERWNNKLHWKMANGVSMSYYTKAVSIPAHFATISVSDIDNEEDVPAVCESVYHTLRCVRIVDIFQERMEHKRGANTTWCGTLYFICELLQTFSILEKPDFPTLLQPKYNVATKTYEDVTLAIAPALDPALHLSSQDGWISIGAGRELQLAYKGRRLWCSVCRAGSTSFHEKKYCKQFTCHKCGQRGHHQLETMCEGVIDRIYESS